MTLHSFRALLTNTLIGGVGATATGFVSLALKILLVRELAVREFGVLVSAQAVVGFVGFAAAACIPDAVVWLSARDLEKTGAAGSTLTVGAILATASGVLAALALSLVVGLSAHSSHQAELGATILVLGCIVPLNALGDTFAAGLRSVGALWPKVVALDIGRPALSLLAVGVLAVSGKLSLPSIAFALVGVSAVTSAVPVVLAWQTAAMRPAWPFDVPRVRPLLRYALPLLAAGLLAGPIINNVIPAILALAVSAQDVALYAASLALQNVVNIPTGVAEQAILPRWSLMSGPSRAGFQTVTRWALLLASVPFAVLWLVPSDVLTLVYGPRYGGAGLLVKIAALSAFFSASVGPNEGALRASGDTRWIFMARLIAAICGLGVASALMPSWGALGAVLGFSTATTLVNALFAIRLWRLQAVQPISATYVRALVAMAAALVGTRIVISSVSSWPMVAVAATACAYPSLLLLLLTLFGADEPKLALDGMRTLFRRLRPARAAR